MITWLEDTAHCVLDQQEGIADQVQGHTVQEREEKGQGKEQQTLVHLLSTVKKLNQSAQHGQITGHSYKILNIFL